MRYYKVTDGDFIDAVGIGQGNTEITREEYLQILSVIKERPTDPAGQTYRLSTALEWQLTELSVDQDPEITDSAALSIIMGGAT